jgi:hypothetical protein
MADFCGRVWKREELLSYIGDVEQVASVRSVVLEGGKSEGVRGAYIQTGGGLSLLVTPGRGMDIPEAYYRGKALHCSSGTGITSPAYYESSGTEWLRSFFVGLLTTCGITYAGAAQTDNGKPLGLHGRVSNAGADDVSIHQGWSGDEYHLSVEGSVREAMAFGEKLRMTRTISTMLGAKWFELHDRIENLGFEKQPLMMLYHSNFGFPLLGPKTRIIAPVLSSEPLTEDARKALPLWNSCEEPRLGCDEKVFSHTLRGDSNGDTFVCLWNEDTGDGTPLGLVMRFNLKKLPGLLEWKLMRKGFYVLGIEPCTVVPSGRENLRAKGLLPYLMPFEYYNITIRYEVIETVKEKDALEASAKSLL